MTTSTRGPSRLSLLMACAAGGLVAVAGVGWSWAQTASQPVDAAQIANTGLVSQGTPACASCHGYRGEGISVQNGPRLAGLNADYIERQLDAFKHGRRASVVMVWVARTLTAEERKALADYYAQLPPVAEGVAPERGLVADGRRLADEGNWPHEIPPCASCHGADGLGVNALTPPLAGQRADYLERQLIDFQQKARRDDPLGLMRAISGRLSSREIRAAAAYYATLPARPAAAAVSTAHGPSSGAHP
jgi:cytochrome c553